MKRYGTGISESPDTRYLVHAEVGIGYSTPRANPRLSDQTSRPKRLKGKVELRLLVTMLPEGVPGVTEIPLGNEPETGMVFGMFTEN